jgi:hypothetical protein
LFSKRAAFSTPPTQNVPQSVLSSAGTTALFSGKEKDKKEENQLKERRDKYV